MVDRLVRPRPLAPLVALAALVVVPAMPAMSACGRYDGQLDDTTPDLDTDLNYLKTKEQRDLANGKGFAMQVVTAASTQVPTNPQAVQQRRVY